jgi:hypothetical protein
MHKMVQPPWKAADQFLAKLAMLIPYNPAIMHFDIYELQTYVTQDLNVDAYSGFIHDCQNLDTIKIVLQWMSRETASRQQSISL